MHHSMTFRTQIHLGYRAQNLLDLFSLSFFPFHMLCKNCFSCQFFLFYLNLKKKNIFKCSFVFSMPSQLYVWIHLIGLLVFDAYLFVLSRMCEVKTVSGKSKLNQFETMQWSTVAQIQLNNSLLFTHRTHNKRTGARTNHHKTILNSFFVKNFCLNRKTTNHKIIALDVVDQPHENKKTIYNLKAK